MKIWYFPILLLLVALTYSYWAGYTPALLGVAYFIVSLVSYLLYAKDKKAARAGAWRVSENTLHLSALVGGWPGSIVGQQRLRHKTQKVSFRIVFYIMLLLNVGLLSFLHTPYGSHKLHTYIYNMENWTVSQFDSNLGVTVLLKLTKFRYDE